MIDNIIRSYNFGAGPSMLPTEIILKIQRELLNWNNTGVSILEIGHRTSEVQELIANVEVKLRKVMQIPNNYKVLFMHGGAQGQFSGIPMNLTRHNHTADYMISGLWSQKAATAAKKYVDVNIIFDDVVDSLPDIASWQKKLNPNASYLYYCPNETITGIRFPFIPTSANVPLVADMTSLILSESIDVNKFGLIFAAVQKNLGVAGNTVVIVRDDLLNQRLDITPEIWNYTLLANSNSTVNTIVVLAIYIMDLMLDWLINLGGVEAMELINLKKAHKLYDYIDSSKLYYNTIKDDYRSIMNVSFNLHNHQNPHNNLLQKFLLEASNNNLLYIKGHASVGGCRASLYNAMPESGVDALIKFMQEFEFNN